MSRAIHPNEADASLTLADGFPVLVVMTDREPGGLGRGASYEWDLYLTNGQPAPDFVHRKIDKTNQIRIDAALDEACINAAIDAVEFWAERAAYAMEDR